MTQAGYKFLLSYQYSSIIYDLTVEFCVFYLSGRELLRQRDQMTQAARSGKQNIVEGYSLESLESYIKLLGVAHGSDLYPFPRIRNQPYDYALSTNYVFINKANRITHK